MTSHWGLESDENNKQPDSGCGGLIAEGGASTLYYVCFDLSWCFPASGYYFVPVDARKESCPVIPTHRAVKSGDGKFLFSPQS